MWSRCFGRYGTQLGAAVTLVAGLMVTAGAAHAVPTLTNLSYTKSGNDVKVTFGVIDLGRDFEKLPITLMLKLWEDDIAFDNLLGSSSVKITVNNIFVLAGGEFNTINDYMFTF